MGEVQTRPAAFDDTQVLALLRLHLAGMQRHTPADHVHALDLTGLQAANVSLFTAWDGDQLLAMGALKEIDAANGEIKSMRTDPRHLRKGAAAAMLDHLIALARQRGYRRISLETGSGPAFDAALALYRRRGFAKGDAFAAYTATDFNQFYHLDLTP